MKKIGVKYLKNVEDELDENIGEKQWTADMYYDKYIIWWCKKMGWDDQLAHL